MHDTMKIARVKRNITLKKLRELTGCSVVTLNQIENGVREPFQSTTRKIEQVLGPVDWTLTYNTGKTLRQHPELIIDTN